MSSNPGPAGLRNATWVEPGHFYSPIVNPTDPQVIAILDQFEKLELSKDSGIALDHEKMIAFFLRLAKRYPQLPFVPKQQAGLHYYYENPLFSYGDAIMLGLMMLEFRPKRIVEVGSGYSSAAMIDIKEQVLGGDVELTFIEPYPDRLLGLLPNNSRYTDRLHAEPVQSVSLDVFKQLQANDILFVDSAHVSKMGSDVNHLVFNVFPLLNPGVLIHVHDIFYPFEYPPSWILQENRSWNEAYLLRAFLQFNNSFEILFFNHFAVRKFFDVLQQNAPLFVMNGGGSLWIRRMR